MQHKKREEAVTVDRLGIDTLIKDGMKKAKEKVREVIEEESERTHIAALLDAGERMAAALDPWMVIGFEQDTRVRTLVLPLQNAVGVLLRLDQMAPDGSFSKILSVTSIPGARPRDFELL